MYSIPDQTRSKFLWVFRLLLSSFVRLSFLTTALAAIMAEPIHKLNCAAASTAVPRPAMQTEPVQKAKSPRQTATAMNPAK